MSGSHDADSRLRWWLEDRADARVPDYVDEMLARTRLARQRSGWFSAARWLPSAGTGHVALRGPVVLVLLLALLTMTFVAAGAGSGWLDWPTDRRGEAPASASPSTPPHLPSSGLIERGEYSYQVLQDARRPTAVPPLLITFTVAADGWESWADGVVKEGATPPLMVGIGFADIANVYADPCHWKSGPLEPALGPTVDDLAVALAALPGFDLITAPTATAVDGYTGKYLALRIAEDVVLADCDDGTFKSYIWTDGDARYHEGPGQIEEFWIVDVEGTRLVINAASFPDTDAGHLAERDAIIDSITIEPPE